MQRVRGAGSLHARIVVVAEAPGEAEDRVGRPLVGPSGQLLDQWWARIGLGREMLRLENVIEVRPPGNKLDAISKEDKAAWIDDLHGRLVKLTDPWVIVAVGNLSLFALTGRVGITKWRSSVLTYTMIDGRTIKCVPTIHPAATFREPYYAKRCMRDWERVASESKFREVVTPQRTHVTRPTLRQIEEYADAAIASGAPISIDIETPHDRIGCVGFSVDPAVSMTIPTMGYWKKAEAAFAWYVIRELCESANEKVLQNGLFDLYWLRMMAKIEVANFKWDTLAMHHALDAADDHDLAFLASMFTNQPYWKDEAKDPESLAKYLSNLDALWVYNGIDACVQRELKDTLQEHLIAKDRLDFYLTHYPAFFGPLLDLMCHGVAIDEMMRRKRLTKLIAKRLTLEASINLMAGTPIIAKTGVSGKKLIEYIKTLGIKLPKKRSAARQMMVETVDETALRRLVKRYPKFEPVGQRVLEHRRAKKESESYEQDRVDADGRMRSWYKFTTSTGRLASTANPMGTGANAQNVDRDARGMFVPDEGCVFVEVDLSQAENRVVDVLSGDDELYEIAHLPPNQFDTHTFNAAIIFEKAESEITKAERYLGKRGVHASNYGMAGDTLSDQLAREGIFIASAKCAQMIERYHARFPAIRAWQRSIRATVLREQCLWNSWGRPFDVSYAHLNDETYRMCYAFTPQAEVIDWINQYGLLPFHAWAKHTKGVAINLHVHDALVSSVKRDVSLIHETVCFLNEHLCRTRTLTNGRELRMFCEFKIGPRWGTGVEFKDVPTIEQIKEVLDAV